MHEGRRAPGPYQASRVFGKLFTQSCIYVYSMVYSPYEKFAYLAFLHEFKGHAIIARKGGVPGIRERY